MNLDSSSAAACRALNPEGAGLDGSVPTLQGPFATRAALLGAFDLLLQPERFKDYGPNGLGTPVTVFTFAPQTFTNTEITSDSTVWPAFRSFHGDGANALDNFSAQAVPEPGMLALWMSGLLGLGCWLRRNQSAARK